MHSFASITSKIKLFNSTGIIEIDLSEYSDKKQI